MTMGPVTCGVCGGPNHGDVQCSQLLGMAPLGDAALEYLRRWLQDHPQTSIPTGAQRALIARIDAQNAKLATLLEAIRVMDDSRHDTNAAYKEAFGWDEYDRVVEVATAYEDD